MFMVYWIVFSVIFGSIVGNVGWQEPELGGMLGLLFATISLIVFLICRDDALDRVARDPAEEFLDDIFF